MFEEEVERFKWEWTARNSVARIAKSQCDIRHVLECRSQTKRRASRSTPGKPIIHGVGESLLAS